MARINFAAIWAHAGCAIQALGGKRFVLALGAGVVTSLLCWYAKISDEIYRDVILGTVGIYIAGNVTEKIKKQVQGASDGTAAA